MTKDAAAIIDRDIALLDAANGNVNDGDGDDDDDTQERDAEILTDDGRDVKWTEAIKGAPTRGVHAKH